MTSHLPGGRLASSVPRSADPNRPPLQTSWRILAVAPWRGRLSVTLTVDTTADNIVREIEKAARRQGIELERLKQ